MFAPRCGGVGRLRSLAQCAWPSQRASSLQAGLVGLPNVGKSSLFNALMEATQARAENFPFCTIEPNIGVCSVPDERLDRLGALHSSERVLPTSLRFVDVSVWREEAERRGTLALICTTTTDVFSFFARLLLLSYLTSRNGHPLFLLTAVSYC